MDPRKSPMCRVRRIDPAHQFHASDELFRRATASCRRFSLSNRPTTIAPDRSRHFEIFVTRRRETTEVQANSSDARVPGVTRLRGRRAQAFYKSLEVAGHGQVIDVFHALVAELAGDANTKRAA